MVEDPRALRRQRRMRRCAIGLWMAAPIIFVVMLLLVVDAPAPTRWLLQFIPLLCFSTGLLLWSRSDPAYSASSEPDDD